MKRHNYSTLGTMIGLCCVGISLAGCVAVLMVIGKAVWTLVEMIQPVVA
jgi:hypothetical protein